MPDKIALCIERSLQNFSVVSTSQSRLTGSGSNVDNISVIFLYSSSLILLFVLISIDKDSFVGYYHVYNGTPMVGKEHTKMSHMTLYRK